MVFARPCRLLSACCASLFVLGAAGGLRAQLIRGDVNCSGFVSAVDAYDLLQHLFSQGVLPCDCEEARDADHDGRIALSDTMFLFSHLALGGPQPQAPYPDLGPGSGLLPCASYPTSPFKRGDVNGDGCVNIKDSTDLSDFLFGTVTLKVDCEKARDANDDGAVNLSDLVEISNYCKGTLPTLPAPGPLSAGDDPTADALSCTDYPLAARATGCVNQLPSDLTQNGRLDLLDATGLLGNIFLNDPPILPCGDGRRDHPSTVRLLDANGSGKLDLLDALVVLRTIYIGDAVPVLGRACTWIEACPQNAACPSCP